MGGSTVWHGVLAGMAGSVAMLMAQRAVAQSQLLPGAFGAGRAETAPAEKPDGENAPYLTSVGYGAALGAAFGAIRARSAGVDYETAGLLLGVGSWGLSHLLPGSIVPSSTGGPTDRYTALVGPLVAHLSFGLGTAYAFHELHEQGWTVRLKRKVIWSVSKSLVRTAIARAL